MQEHNILNLSNEKVREEYLSLLKTVDSLKAEIEDLNNHIAYLNDNYILIKK